MSFRTATGGEEPAARLPRPPPLTSKYRVILGEAGALQRKAAAQSKDPYPLSQPLPQPGILTMPSQSRRPLESEQTLPSSTIHAGTIPILAFIWKHIRTLHRSDALRRHPARR